MFVIISWQAGLFIVLIMALSFLSLLQQLNIMIAVAATAMTGICSTVVVVLVLADEEEECHQSYLCKELG